MRTGDSVSLDGRASGNDRGLRAGRARAITMRATVPTEARAILSLVRRAARPCRIRGRDSGPVAARPAGAARRAGGGLRRPRQERGLEQERSDRQAK
jgi:hypothetical protein